MTNDVQKLRMLKIKEACWFFVQRMRLTNRRFAIKNSNMCKKFKISGEVFLTYDDSIWQSGNNGFIITSDGVFAKESFGEVIHVSFDTLSAMASGSGDIDLVNGAKAEINGLLIAYCTGANHEIVKIICNKIVMLQKVR